MEDINIQKTITKMRLSYKTHFLEMYEILYSCIILLLIGFIFYLVWISSKDLLSLGIISCIFFLYIGYAIYKEYKCKQLTELNTKSPIETNESLLSNILDQKGYKIKFHNKDYIRALSKFNYLFCRRELTIILIDNKLYINIVNTTGLVRYPAIVATKRFIKSIENLK